MLFVSREVGFINLPQPMLFYQIHKKHKGQVLITVHQQLADHIIHPLHVADLSLVVRKCQQDSLQTVLYIGTPEILKLLEGSIKIHNDVTFCLVGLGWVFVHCLQEEALIQLVAAHIQIVIFRVSNV